MSTTLTKGYKLPQTGDRNFWSDLSFDIQRLNDHKHDGVDSVSLTPYNIAKGTNTISSANWVAVGGGTYKQTITMPTNYLFDESIIKHVVTSGTHAGKEILATLKKITASSYEIYVNDNTMDLIARYG